MAKENEEEIIFADEDDEISGLFDETKDSQDVKNQPVPAEAEADFAADFEKELLKISKPDKENEAEEKEHIGQEDAAAEEEIFAEDEIFAEEDAFAEKDIFADKEENIFADNEEMVFAEEEPVFLDPDKSDVPENKTPADLFGILGEEDDDEMQKPKADVISILSDESEEEEKRPANLRRIIEDTPEEGGTIRLSDYMEQRSEINNWLTRQIGDSNIEDDMLIESNMQAAFYEKFNQLNKPQKAMEPEERRNAENAPSEWAERRRRRSMQRENERRRMEGVHNADRESAEARRLMRTEETDRPFSPIRPVMPPVEEKPEEAKPEESKETKEEEVKPEEKKTEEETGVIITPQKREMAAPKKKEEDSPKPAKKKAGKKKAPASKIDTEDPKFKLIMIAVVICVFSIVLAVKANSAWVMLYGIPSSESATLPGFGTVMSSPKIEEPNFIVCLMTSFTDPNVGIRMGMLSGKTFFGTFFTVAAICALVYFFIWTDQDAKKRQRDGHEHGFKKLATKTDIKKYQEKYMEKSDYNILFSKQIGLSLDNKRTNRSANVLVIGGTGTGKTFRYIKPNILQENASQIITDPSGDLFRSFGPYLIKKGYNVYLFNVSDMGTSNHYNPLLNVYDADGEIDSQKVDVLVDLYMKNASAGKEGGGGDPFWEKSEKAFLTGVIYYVLENDGIPKEEKCFNTVLKKVQLARAEEGKKGDTQTKLTKEIKEWQMRMEKEGREIKCPLYYDTFLIAPDKTANTILITTAVDLQIFSNEHVDRITRWNSKYPDININLDDIGSTQTYVFLGIPQSHQAYNFLIAMLYSQLYGRLYDLGERGYVGKWLLEDTPGIPCFNPFDSKEDAEAFMHDCSVYGTDQDNGNIRIVMLPYINKTCIYRLRWAGRGDKDKNWVEGSVYKQFNGVYKKSFVKECLEELIAKAPSMNLRCNSETPQLPIHVNFLLDEFKNIGEIPNFLTILSTSRKYRIGSHVIIQDVAQLKTMYPDDEHQTLLANVDTTIFLGSILMDDKELIQKMLGKTTIKQRSTSHTKQGTTTSLTPTEVDLVSMDEMGKINEGDNQDCYVIIRDITPFLDKKLNLLEHKRWPDVCAIKDKYPDFNHEIYYKNNLEPELYNSVSR